VRRGAAPSGVRREGIMMARDVATPGGRGKAESRAWILAARAQASAKETYGRVAFRGYRRAARSAHGSEAKRTNIRRVVSTE
jgi:hypothetical protein